MNVTTEQGAQAQEERQETMVCTGERRRARGQTHQFCRKNKDSETGASRCALTSVVDQKQS